MELERLHAPVREVGQFFAMIAEVGRCLVTTRFRFGEFVEQSWMLARVSLLPTILIVIFGIIALTDRLRGGYKPVDLEAAMGKEASPL